MTNLTWVGGGNNQASNRNNWSPTGVPQPGDYLATPYMSQTFTMNVRGDDLAGDTFTIHYSTFTINLSNHAVATINEWDGNSGVFNLSQNSTLDLSLITGAHVGSNYATVNISGNDHFTLHNRDALVNINMGKNDQWNGTVDLGEYFGVVSSATTTVNGGTFNNNGHSLISNTENFVVNSNVVGSGSFDVTNTGSRGYAPQSALSIAHLEFVGSVGAKQVVTDSGMLVIDRPNDFDAHVYLSAKDNPTYNPTTGVYDPAPFQSEIDLVGLANVTSYSFRNDMLKLYSGNTIVDKLDLTDQTPHGFAVLQGYGAVNIVTILDPARAPAGLPLHA